MTAKKDRRELMSRIQNKLLRDKKGQALPILLVLLLMGGLNTAPLLPYVNSCHLPSDTVELFNDIVEVTEYEVR